MFFPHQGKHLPAMQAAWVQTQIQTKIFSAPILSGTLPHALSLSQCLSSRASAWILLTGGKKRRIVVISLQHHLWGENTNTRMMYMGERGKKCFSPSGKRPSARRGKRCSAATGGNQADLSLPPGVESGLLAGRQVREPASQGAVTRAHRATPSRRKRNGSRSSTGTHEHF